MAKDNFKKMSVSEIRQYMANRGWISEDQMTYLGWRDWGYTIWFSRWNWNKKQLGSPIKFHASSSCINPRRIRKAVIEAAGRALEAELKFPTVIPYQTVNGEVKKDEFLTDNPIPVKATEPESINTVPVADLK